jgi:GntR family transcriptional regulator, transcriptional repressor for pyruvate dehydrogenase complex
MSESKHLGPIKAIATYELVANQIQRAVALGLLVPGDRLPAERALAQQLGVARMTVREAIRVLAHEGRITVRRGAHGGMWIRAQEVTKRELLQLAADTDRAIGDVYAFRELVEGASARLAAQRATPKDIKKLRNLSSSMAKILQAHLKSPEVSANVARFLALDSQFHSEMAQISANQFIIEAVERGLAARYMPFGAVLRTLSPRANDGHTDLVDAIAAGDSARAEKLMHGHVMTARNALISKLNRHLQTQTGTRTGAVRS